ncbi:DsbA family protein [Novosphingobium panipatense]|jgi:protein-disulfide isomerase|uniref:Protein-disulfide isomerase n=1 Tax=Novosphingobium panipatense TaxID=428991 RepID=A0ABY1QE64_9SPHN|nr:MULTISPECIES: DsbA family protein [Novosphingobium]SMP68062.1 Protein-disulfide isomerase [Novosphingobium panipatense]
MSKAAKFTVVAAGIAVIAAGGWFGGRIAVERVVHDYILQNPEILPQAMDELRRREASKALAGVRQTVETPFPGAILGNPQGAITLVEFSDYACGYCRQSLPDIDRLIAANPDLRIVVRELPIISPHSAEAARMALAAAEQGKYAQFHQAMYSAGQVDAPTIEAVAKKVGLDMERARRVAASPTVEAEISRSMELAQRLGFSGTPSWVAGDKLIPGAVGFDQLSQAVDAARGG